MEPSEGRRTATARGDGDAASPSHRTDDTAIAATSAQRHPVSTQTVVLMRHAKPDFDTSMPVRTSDFGEALSAYDEAGLEQPHAGERAHRIMTSFIDAEGLEGSRVQVVTSDLRRSIESARLFFPSIEADATDPLYREAELPARLPLCAFTMRYSVAIVIARALWRLGIHQHAESYAMAAARAHRAAEALASRAMEHDCVILVGHGFFNRLIARELKQGGWTASRRHGRGFGAYAVFVRDIRGGHCTWSAQARPSLPARRSAVAHYFRVRVDRVPRTSVRSPERPVARRLELPRFHGRLVSGVNGERC